MNKQVLIVDDEEVVRFIHDFIIIKSKIASSTMAFSNGLQVLDYLNRQTDGLQHYLIFLDLNMPVMDGWELLTAFEETHYKDRLEVIIVSSSIDPVDIRRSRSFPMVKTFLSKPLNVDQCITSTG